MTHSIYCSLAISCSHIINPLSQNSIKRTERNEKCCTFHCKWIVKQIIYTTAQLISIFRASSQRWERHCEIRRFNFQPNYPSAECIQQQSAEISCTTINSIPFTIEWHFSVNKTTKWRFIANECNVHLATNHKTTANQSRNNRERFPNFVKMLTENDSFHFTFLINIQGSKMRMINENRLKCLIKQLKLVKFQQKVRFEWKKCGLLRMEKEATCEPMSFIWWIENWIHYGEKRMA